MQKGLQCVCALTLECLKVICCVLCTKSLFTDSRPRVHLLDSCSHFVSHTMGGPLSSLSPSLTTPPPPSSIESSYPPPSSATFLPVCLFDFLPLISFPPPSALPTPSGYSCKHKDCSSSFDTWSKLQQHMKGHNKGQCLG